MEKWYSKRLEAHLNSLLRQDNKALIESHLKLLSEMAEGGDQKRFWISNETLRKTEYIGLPDEYFSELLARYREATRKNS